jgi:PIN domain nuclease of toxin-antitoxin system
MATKRYLLDTCAIKWHLHGDKRMKKYSEEISYFDGDFAVSIESLKELAHLVILDKIKIDIDLDKLYKYLKDANISIINFTEHEFLTLIKIPFIKEHRDPIDRQIIASAITNHRILISGDSMFEKSTNFGLMFMQV